MNDAVKRGLEFLMREENRNKPFAVRAIEEGVRPRLPAKTLASPFNRLVKAGKGGIVRANATYGDSKRKYRGFMYVGD